MTMAGIGGSVTAILVALPGDPDPAASASGKGPEWGKAAPIALLIVLLLGLALYLLIKSMNRNLRKVPASFDTDDGSEDVDRAEDVNASESEGSGEGAAQLRDRPGRTDDGSAGDVVSGESTGADEVGDGARGDASIGDGVASDGVVGDGARGEAIVGDGAAGSPRGTGR